MQIRVANGGLESGKEEIGGANIGLFAANNGILLIVKVAADSIIVADLEEKTGRGWQSCGRSINKGGLGNREQDIRSESLIVGHGQRKVVGAVRFGRGVSQGNIDSVDDVSHELGGNQVLVALVDLENSLSYLSVVVWACFLDESLVLFLSGAVTRKLDSVEVGPGKIVA